MNFLVDLAFQYVPKIIDAVHLLKKAPEAVETVKDLTAYVQNVTARLKQEVPLTPAQKADVDKWLDGLEDEDYWQQEKPASG